MQTSKLQIGDIQSSSFIIGYRPKDGLILCASSNIDECFGASWEMLISTNIKDYLPEDLLHKCNNIASHSTISLLSEYVGHISCHEEQCAMYASTDIKFDDLLFLEFLPVPFQSNPDNLNHTNQLSVITSKLSITNDITDQLDLLTSHIKHLFDFHHACVFLKTKDSSRTVEKIIYESPYVIPQGYESEQLLPVISQCDRRMYTASKVNDWFVSDIESPRSSLNMKIAGISNFIGLKIDKFKTKTFDSESISILSSLGICSVYIVSAELDINTRIGFCFFHSAPKAIRIHQQEFAKLMISVSLPYLRNEALLFSHGDMSATQTVSIASSSSEAAETTISAINTSVLVVDDDLLIATDLRQMLLKAGVNNADIASSENEALDLLASNKYSLVLLDRNLDGTESVQVANKLNEKNIPFVYVTGYESVLEQGDKSSCIGALKKPVMQRNITKLVNENIQVAV